MFELFVVIVATIVRAQPEDFKTIWQEWVKDFLMMLTIWIVIFSLNFVSLSFPFLLSW